MLHTRQVVDRQSNQGIHTLKKDFDWQAFGSGSWADEYPGLRELLEEKVAEQKKEKRDAQTK
jgi:hypothetical protein